MPPQKTAGVVTFRQLLVQLFPEGSREDIQILMRMARPKNYLPQAKPDEQVSVRHILRCGPPQDEHMHAHGWGKGSGRRGN